MKVENSDQQTIEVLERLRDELNEGLSLFYISGDDCQDGSKVMTIGVYPPSGESTKEER